MEKPFGSDITRAIWGDPENVLLIYAGSAAEFALNPENHWLFYTGRLPSDPLGRLGETLEYQRKLFLMPGSAVPGVAQHIKGIHRKVEIRRSEEEGSMRITDRAYLQVFAMLIEYGILGWEYLHRRRLERARREEYFNDIRSIARMMEIGDFPQDYHHYLTLRTGMVVRELQFNARTRDLMVSYRKALGPLKYWVLLQFQARFMDPILVKRLNLKAGRLFGLFYWFYPRLRFRNLFFGLAALMLDRDSQLLLRRTAAGFTR